MDNTLDNLISTQIALWLRWLEYDKRARNIDLDVVERRKAVEECERIVNEKYKTMSLMNECIDGLARA